MNGERILTIGGVPYKCTFFSGYDGHYYCTVYDDRDGRYLGQITDIRDEGIRTDSRIKSWVEAL